MEDSKLYGNKCPGERGNTRAPKFGEMLRGVWAGEGNPHRDGMFVRTVRKTGRMNPGTWHELTDGKGAFWRYEAKSTVFLTESYTSPPRFENVSCSQCGMSFGPGNQGFSHCRNHIERYGEM